MKMRGKGIMESMAPPVEMVTGGESLRRRMARETAMYGDRTPRLGMGRKRRGKGFGEDLLSGLQDVGREAAAIAAPIIKETFRRKLQQGADNYIESGNKKGSGRRRRGKGIGEDILGGLKQATKEAVEIAAPIVADTIKRKARQRFEGGRRGKGFGEDLLSGLQSVGKEAVAIAAPILKETFKRKLQQGADQYIESGEKKGGMRCCMSAAQIRKMKKGGAFQFSPSMLSDMGRYEMSLQPRVMDTLQRNLMKGKGMRIGRADIMNMIDMKRGGSIFSDVVNPKTYISNYKAMTGSGIVEEIAGAFRKKHGGGDFEDFFEKRVPKILIREGIPLAGTVAGAALGSYLGGPLGGTTGAVVGNTAGTALGDYVGDKTGYGLYARAGKGLYAGAGVIQTGSPYVDHRSPAYHPFKEKVNPFT